MLDQTRPNQKATAIAADEWRGSDRAARAVSQRVEHARRMGWMCDRVIEAGGTVIASYPHWAAIRTDDGEIDLAELE